MTNGSALLPAQKESSYINYSKSSLGVNHTRNRTVLTRGDNKAVETLRVTCLIRPDEVWSLTAIRWPAYRAHRQPLKAHTIYM